MMEIGRKEYCNEKNNVVVCATISNVDIFETRSERTVSGLQTITNYANPFETGNKILIVIIINAMMMIIMSLLHHFCFFNLRY